MGDVGAHKVKKNKASKSDILSQHEFYDKHFSNLDLEKIELQNKTFENCYFDKINFSEAKIIACKFVDCEFEFCNLTAAQINQSSFSEVIFDECKLIGINWIQAKWPSIQLTSPIKFYRSNISHSSFYELDLTEIVIEECKAQQVDFREGDFSDGVFTLTDFEGSLFMHSKLHAADFIDAINYSINPLENDIRKAKFSMPDAINLLHSFEIELQGI